MNEEYLKSWFESYVKPAKPDADYNDWVSKIQTNESYKRGMFDQYVLPNKPDANYDEWNGKIFGQSPSVLETTSSLLGSAIRGAGETLIADPLKLVATGAQALERNFPQVFGEPRPIEEYATYQYGQAAEDALRESTYVNPQVENTTAGQVARGLGTAGAMMLTGVAGTGRKGLQMTATELPAAVEAGTQLAQKVLSPSGVVAGAMTAVPEFEAAKQAGLSDEDAFDVLVKNYAVGQTEAIPISNFLGRLNKLTNNGLIGLLKTSAVGGLEEAVQEGVQTYLTNQVAKEAYDPERDPLFQLAESMTVGGLVGLILPGIGAAVQATTSPTVKQKLQTKAEQLQAKSTIVEQANKDITETEQPLPAEVVGIQDQQLDETITDIQNAKSVSIDEGSVPQTGTITQASQDQSSQDIQQSQEEVSTETGQVEFIPAQESTIKGNIRETIRPSSPEVVTNEYTLLKDKIRNLARGSRIGNIEAKKAIKGIGKELQSIIEKQQLPAKAQNQILKRATSVNFNNPVQVERLLTYADKVTQDAAYADKIEQAEGIKSKIRDKVPNLPVEQKQVVKDLLKVKEEDVDIDQHLGLLQGVTDSFKPVDRGYAPLPLDAIKDHVDASLQAKEEIISKTTEGLSDDDRRAVLTPIAQASKIDLPQGETPIQKKVIEQLKKADFSKLSPSQIRQYIKVADNIAANNSFGGSAELAARVEAEATNIDAVAKKFDTLFSSTAKGTSREISTFSEFMNDMFGYNEAAAEFYSKSGFADMHKQSAQVEEESNELKQRVHKKVEELNRQKGRDLYSPESQTLMSVWAELQQRIPTETEQEGFARAKTNIEKDLAVKQATYPDQYALEIKDWGVLGKAETLQQATEIMKSKYPKEHALVKYLQDELKPYSKPAITAAETLYNKTAVEQVNYLPITTRPTLEQVDDTVEETDILLGNREIPTKPKQGGSTKNRIMYLPDGYYRERDFLYNLFSSHKRTLYDIKVAPEVLKVREFLRSNKAKEVLQNTQNLNDFIYLFNNQVRYQRGAGSKGNWELVNKTLSALSKIGYTRALGGPTTAITQSIPTLVNTTTNLGTDMPILFRMTGNIGDKSFREASRNVMKLFPIGQRLQKMGGIDMGELVDIRTKGSIRKNIFSTLRPFKLGLERVHEYIMTPFAYGDAKPAELAWMSYYVKSLKDQGASIKGYTKADFWNNELSLQETEERKLAAAYAEQMVNSNLNPSQGEQFAPVLRANTISGQLIKGSGFPLVSFKLNQGKRLTKNFARLFTSSGQEQVEAAKVFVAILSEIFAYTLAANYIARPLISDPIEQVVRDLFDIPKEDDDDSEFRKRVMFTNIARDLTPWALNDATTNPSLELYNKMLYELSDEGMDYEDWVKEHGLVIFKPKQGVEEFGIFGMGATPFIELEEDLDILYDDVLEEPSPYSGEPQEIDLSDNQDFILFSSIVNLLSASGIGIRELNSAKTKLKKQIKREARSGGDNLNLPPLPLPPQ